MGLVQYALILVLTPLIAGVILVALGARVPARVGLAIAILATAIDLAAALGLATNLLPEGPLLLRAIPWGDRGIVFRLDGFAAWLAVGFAGWVGPVLVWMTFPRPRADAPDRPTLAPVGLALIAVGLGLGAIMNDNLLLIALCWSGAAFITWMMARPNVLERPRREEWLDLALLTGGVLLTLVALAPLLIRGKNLSLYNLSGTGGGGFGQGFFLIVALAFAAGAYPFTIWVRRVGQGIMTDAVGALALVVLPLPVILAARFVAVYAGTTAGWPKLANSIVTIPLNVVWIIIGVATIAVASLTALFERDLPILTLLLGLVPLGWALTAIGTGDSHALLGVVLLLAAYLLGVGTLLAVWASCEWSGRDLEAAALTDLAAHSSPHALAALLGGLTLCGFPLLLGFSGMLPVAGGLLALGGAAALAAAIGWIGSAVALVAFMHAIRLAFTRSHPAEAAAPDLAWEGTSMIVPLIILLLAGVAPELVLLGQPAGLAAQATAALLPSGTSLPDLTTSTLGFSLGTFVWLPGLFWALTLGSALMVILSTGLIGPRPAPSAIFTGGEPPDPSYANAPIDDWDDLATVPRSGLALPGPAAWRKDIGNPELWEDAKPAEDVDGAITDEVDHPFAEMDDDPDALRDGTGMVAETEKRERGKQ